LRVSETQWRNFGWIGQRVDVVTFLSENEHGGLTL